MMDNMTQKIMKVSYAVFRRYVKKQEEHIRYVFASGYDMRDADVRGWTASRIMKGEYMIPMPIIKKYASLEHPECPEALRDDLTNYIKAAQLTRVERTRLYSDLWEIAQAMPDEDRQELLSDVLPEHPTAEQTAEIWATVLWYAACEDHARKALAA